MQAEQQSERERFEAWCLEYHEQVPKWTGTRYQDAVWIELWEAWQARAALSHPSTPQGWKLVPVEPTQEMIEAAASFGGRGGYSKQLGDEAVISYADMINAAPLPPEQGGKG